MYIVALKKLVSDEFKYIFKRSGNKIPLCLPKKFFFLAKFQFCEVENYLSSEHKNLFTGPFLFFSVLNDSC